MDQINEAPHTAVDVSPTRRAFYIGFINGAMSLIGLALAVPAAIYLLFPPKLRKQAEWVDTADLSTIPTGTPTEIAFQRTRVDGWKVTTEKSTAWVVKKPNNEVVAFTPPHRQAVCLEPYTWTTDAINLQQQGVNAGLRVLAPGEQWTGVVEMVRFPV